MAVSRPPDRGAMGGLCRDARQPWQRVDPADYYETIARITRNIARNVARIARNILEYY